VLLDIDSCDSYVIL